MLEAVVVLALIGVVAALVLGGAEAVERAVAIRARERRSAHWRRIAEAAFDVQSAADRYAEAMAGRAGVDHAARAYRAATRRLTLVAASGPTPLRLRPLLLILGDAHHPENVSATRAGDDVLAELAELQAVIAARDADRGVHGLRRRIGAFRAGLAARRHASR